VKRGRFGQLITWRCLPNQINVRYDPYYFIAKTILHWYVMHSVSCSLRQSAASTGALIFIAPLTLFTAMAPVKPIVKAIQDMPPKGGYPKVCCSCL